MLRQFRQCLVLFSKRQFSPNNSFPSKKSYHLLSARQLSERMKSEKNLKLIDVRDFDLFLSGHIRSAVNVDKFFFYLVGDSLAKTMAKLRADFASTLSEAGIQRTDSVVTYEGSMETCNGASCRAHFILKYLGVKDVTILHGGLAAWKKEGYDLCTDPHIVEPTVFEPEEDSSRIADKLEMKHAMNDPNAVIVDCRNTKEWEGTISSPYGPDYCPRKGRIPGAIWIPWVTLMEEDSDGIKKIKSSEKVKEICRNAGMNTNNNNSPVIVYCFKGARAANTQIALESAGFNNVKNYFASWNEWSRDPSLPVDSKVIYQH